MSIYILQRKGIDIGDKEDYVIISSWTAHFTAHMYIHINKHTLTAKNKKRQRYYISLTALTRPRFCTQTTEKQACAQIEANKLIITVTYFQSFYASMHKIQNVISLES